VKKVLFCLASCTLFSSFSLQAQRSIYFTQSNAPLYKATHYAFLKVPNESKALLQDVQVESSYLQTQAEYLRLLAGLMLRTPDAEVAFRNFLSTCPPKPLQSIGYMELAKYCFHLQRFAEARDLFEQMSADFLSASERAARNKWLSYCYLANGPSSSLKNRSGLTSAQPEARYRQFHLLYSEGNYPASMSILQSLSSHADYQRVAVYYPMEAAYLQGQVKELRTQLLQSLPASDAAATYQLLAQLSMDSLHFEQAAKELSQSLQSTDKTRRETLFRLAYCCYQTGKFREARALFEGLYPSNDKIAQYSAYYIAQCGLSMQEFTLAYNALLQCVNIKQDLALCETAEFQLAKISLRNGDRDWALRQLESFLARYPQSTYREEAIQWQLYLLLTKGLYTESQQQLAQNSEQYPALPNFFQTSALSEALRLLEQGDPAHANQLLDLAAQYPSDQKTAALIAFWQAECSYRLGRYSEALEYSQDYEQQAKGLAIHQDYQKKIQILRCYLFLHLNQTENLKAEYNLLYPSYKGNPASTLGTLKPLLNPGSLQVSIPEIPEVLFQLPEAPFPFDYHPYLIVPEGISQEFKVFPSYLKGGLGNLGNRELETGIDLSEWTHTPVYLRGGMSSVQGKLPGQLYRDGYLGLHSSFVSAQHEVETYGTFRRNTQYYYGYDRTLYPLEIKDLRQQFSQLKIGMKLSPRIENPWHIRYKPEVQLGRYSDRRGADEISLRADLPFEKQLNEEASASLGVHLNLNRYASPLFGSQHNSVLSIRPAVSYRWHRLQLKAGFYPTLGQSRHLLPDLSAAYPLPALQGTLGLTYAGRLLLNTFQELNTLNPFLFNSFAVKQSRERTLSLTLAGNLGTHGSYSLRGGLGNMTHLPLFLNDVGGDMKQFQVLMADQARFFAGDLLLDFRAGNHMTLGGHLWAKPLLNWSNYEKPWHYVPAGIDVHAHLNLSRSLSVRSEFFIRFGYPHLVRSSSTQSLLTQTSNLGMDANLLAELRLHRRWNAYAQVYNLFGTAYQRWYGYANLGPHFRAGLLYRFGKWM